MLWSLSDIGENEIVCTFYELLVPFKAVLIVFSMSKNCEFIMIVLWPQNCESTICFVHHMHQNRMEYIIVVINIGGILFKKWAEADNTSMNHFRIE